MNILSNMSIFAAVVQHKGFTSAAEQLGSSKSHISKTITKLEQDLGVKLLYRSTRKLSLTEEGEKFYHHCIQVIQSAENAVNELSWYKDKPSGILKITAPTAFSEVILPTIILEIRKNYPELSFEINASNQNINIIEQGYDAAIRFGPLPPSDLFAKRIAEFDMVFCASPKFIYREGIPNNTRELLNFPLAKYHKDLFKNDDLNQIYNRTENRNKYPLISSNNSLLLKELALNHQCISTVPSYLVQEEIESKKLKVIPIEHALPKLELFIVYPSKKFIAQKTQILIDAITNYFKTL